MGPTYRPFVPASALPAKVHSGICHGLRCNQDGRRRRESKGLLEGRPTPQGSTVPTTLPNRLPRVVVRTVELGSGPTSQTASSGSASCGRGIEGPQCTGGQKTGPLSEGLKDYRNEEKCQAKGRVRGPGGQVG